MFRNVMSDFDVTVSEHCWENKWCVDVHNIYPSKNISGCCPLEISEGRTQDISKIQIQFVGAHLVFQEM